MKAKKKRLLTAFVVLVCHLGMMAVLSCQDALFYTEYKDLPKNLWDGRDTVTFLLPATEKDMDVMLTVGMRTTNKFGYQRVAAKADVCCGHRTVSSLPFDIELYTGKKTKGQGLMIRNNLSNPQPLHLKAGHQYKIRLTHNMWLNPLDEVLALGILVEK